MEHLAHRCATVAAAALAVAGMVTALTPTTPSLPDLQIRDVDMASANVDTTSIIDTLESHVRPELAGSGVADEIQQINLGDLLTGNGDGELGDGSPFNAGDLDESALSALLSAGGGFDAQSVLGAAPVLPDLGVIGAPTVGVSGTEQAAGSAAASALAGLSMALNGLPAAYQSLLTGIANAELAFNNALVEAQLGVVGQLDGSDAASDIAHFVFIANNSIVAQNEQALNSLLGIDFSGDTLHNSLFGDFDPGSAAFGADWDALLASFSPDVVSAVLHDNLALLLADLDIPSYLVSFILGIF